MDRPIVYVNENPLDTDFLGASKSAMIGLGMALQAILGTSTVVDGLNCTPTGPASLQVLVTQGSIYAQENVDNTAYGSLAADTTHQIVKQGINLGTLTLNCPAPSTTGFSVNYLIEAGYQDVDTGSTVLPYYNSSNPSVAYNGPGGSGTSQNTVRQGQCVVQVKAGIAATTGTQATPAADSGFVGLWVVTVANGQTMITSGNIVKASGAPFIPAKLPTLAGSLIAANNLSDLASLATSLTNLGFASDSASWFKLPNPNNTAKPWIVQFGAKTDVSTGLGTLTLPVSFPNAIKTVIATADATNSSYNDSVDIQTLTTTSFVYAIHSAVSTSATNPGTFYWIAIGN